MYFVAVFVQIVLAVGPFVLEHFTKTSVGVMHHVYFKKIEYANGIYSHTNLRFQSIMVLILGIIFLFMLIYGFKKKCSMFLKINMLLVSVYSLAVYLVINSEFFFTTMSYPYFVMAIEIVLLIQIIIVGATLFFK